MKTVEQYISEIEETFKKSDSATMSSIVETLKSEDPNTAYEVCAKAMLLNEIGNPENLARSKWSHRFLVNLMLNIYKQRTSEQGEVNQQEAESK